MTQNIFQYFKSKCMEQIHNLLMCCSLFLELFTTHTSVLQSAELLNKEV